MAVRIELHHGGRPPPRMVALAAVVCRCRRCRCREERGKNCWSNIFIKCRRKHVEKINISERYWNILRNVEENTLKKSTFLKNVGTFCNVENTR
jgi:hypothetical protein